MELAQSLILTNALGGLSSLGHGAEEGLLFHNGATARLYNYELELCYSNNLIEVSILDVADGLRRRVRVDALHSLLPARLIIQSCQRFYSIPLHLESKHLAARLSELWPPRHVSVELTIGGRGALTSFVVAHSYPRSKTLFRPVDNAP